ncbi:tetraspanin-19 isoform X2 [Beta vulgaris subsp. vulgaris]|uniref:tetraspanin-19 isoform X2 n=1 Tax=Beta vulgaris subsp. vulgaris TaxID=3555 RepID=UPI002549378B|nr:tetraspanin-19 isoform X2 [Beta vulgaris subsp. vulgaris]
MNFAKKTSKSLILSHTHVIIVYKLKFIYTFLGLGVIFCVITCSGHIAAETLNGCCLYLYMMIVFLLLVLEGVVTADVFLNHHWEQDFPKDVSGNLHELKVFVGENFDFCKWIGLSILAAQGLSFLLAMVLKAMGPHRERYYDSDEEYASTRHPLLRNSANPPHVAVDPLYMPNK